jgi:hypothetical protein
MIMRMTRAKYRYHKENLMSRLTLRLPETLHRQLEAQAKCEGVSLNQFIVYALTRQLTQGYTVEKLPEAAVAQQQAQFDSLLRGLGQASSEILSTVLAAREQVKPEPVLTADVIARLRARLAVTTSDEMSSD